MKALRRSHTSGSSNSSSTSSSISSSSSWIHLRSVLFVVSSSSPSACSSSDRGRIKSPWSRRKRKHALSPEQWRSLFTSDGKLRDGGLKLLRKVRSAGIDPSIRAEVWPFLLGLYDFNSSSEDREVLKTQKRKEYEKLRRGCRQLHKHINKSKQLKESGGTSSDEESVIFGPQEDSEDSEDAVSARESLSSEERNLYLESPNQLCSASEGFSGPVSSTLDSNSSDSDSFDDPEVSNNTFPSPKITEINFPPLKEDFLPSNEEVQTKFCDAEDFSTWQRIIRLDAIRANGEWMSHSPTQASVTNERACRSAEAVGLKDYNHLEPYRIFHAARLVAILEAYALYDPEVGYCQGMSDLLSPIITVVPEDHVAFWCFVGYMRKARHNFRLDEIGIRRQLNTVSKIIKCKDSHLYRHLEKLQAEDCFFVYRMVVVLFRRELAFEQTICLWEVMWADQAAIRAGIGKSAWSRIRLRAPPTDDLLLYAIAASVLQRRKQIIEKHSSMDEILRECNSMAGHLDVWKLLDDAHNLVVTLHDKIKTPL